MDDGSTPRHAPNHMPPVGATGSPQQARDAPLRGPAEFMEEPKTPISNSTRVTPSSTRGGCSAGGMAIPVLLLVVLFLALSMLVLR